MNTSLFSRIFSDNDRHAAQLDAWLAERKIDLALRGDNNRKLDFFVDGERLGKAAAPHDGDVRPGQIRILSPKFVADSDTIPYIAVLEHWMGDLWLVAPFSPYSHPATNGEMETGDHLACRRVLQCWNARTAHESIIEQSYVADSLDESVRADALALFRHVSAGTPLPASFSAPIGAPILSKADPRSDFLSESAKRFAPLTAAVCALEAELARKEREAAFRENARKWAQPICVPAYGTPQYALAAADKQQQTTETFRIPSHDVELDVKHTPSEGKVRLIVYKNGEMDTTSLEGCIVANKEMSFVGEIVNGLLIVEETALKDGFVLVDPDTMEPIVPVKKEHE